MKTSIYAILYISLQLLVGMLFDFSWIQIVIITAIFSIIGSRFFFFRNSTIHWVLFISTLLLWFFYSLFINILNDNQLYTMVGKIFGLPSGYLLVFIQAFFGGFITFLSSWITMMFVPTPSLKQRYNSRKSRRRRR